VEHLGKAGELSVVDALIEILDSDDLWTAYPAADALGRIGNRKAVPHLLAALKRKTPEGTGAQGTRPCWQTRWRLSTFVVLLQDASKNVQEHALADDREDVS